MSLEQIFFLITAVVALGAGVMVVSVRKMMHAALWLVLTLLAVAVLLVMLQLGFFAVMQVLVYIGAIATLIIFAVMMTRSTMQDIGPQVNKRWWIPLLVSLALFGGLALLLAAWSPGQATFTGELAPELTNMQALGLALVNPNGYLIPFEVASVLLLAAMVGAIYLTVGLKEGKK